MESEIIERKQWNSVATFEHDIAQPNGQGNFS